VVAIEFEDGAIVEREALVEATWEDGVEEEIWMGAGRDDVDVDGTLWGIAVVFKLECMVVGGSEGGETERRALEVDEGVESCGGGRRGACELQSLSTSDLEGTDQYWDQREDQIPWWWS